MRGSPAARLACIRIAYCAPVVTGVLSLFFGLYPHLFFKSNGELFDSVSFFGFLENARATCFSVLGNISGSTPGAVYFSYVMAALWALSCLLMLWYAAGLTVTALLVSVSLTPRAASPMLNRIKRIFRMIVPARGFFIVLSLVPVLLSFLPMLFVALYRNLLSQVATLYYDFLPDAVLLALPTAVGIVLYLVTLSDQRELKLDLFRIYRVEEKRGK